MLVAREALLSQLHMALLRQEIVKAELAKIECATTGGHQTQTTPTPIRLPWHVADGGRSKPPMARQNAEFDEHKLPDSNQDALLSQLHMARLRQGTIQAEVAQIERAMALHTATGGGHQEQTTQMPLPWHGVATMDAGRSKARPFSAEQPVAQQNAEFDEHKLLDSNKVVPPSKASPVEKWELTGITIPVTKLKSPMKWNDAICQVQATSEQNLQQHYDGQKHLSNVATLHPTTKASDKKAESAAEHSVGTEQKKTSSVKWSFSTYQANGTSQSTLEAHLKGKRHQLNMPATCVDGDIDGIARNVAVQEAKSHGIDVLKNSEKPWPFIAEQPVAREFDEHKLPDSNKAVPTNKASLVEKWELTGITIPVKELKPPIKWNCTVCQVQATSEQNLQQHYAGQKHLSNVETLDPTTKEEKSHGINVPKNSEKPFIAEQPMAQQFDEHTLTDADKAVPPSKATPVEKWELAEITIPVKEQKPPMKWYCTVCQVQATSEQDLQKHYARQKHLSNVATLDPTTKASDQKAKTTAAAAAEPSLSTEEKKTSSIKWSCSTCQANGTTQLTLEAHLKGKRHQKNIAAATSAGGNKNSMPRNVVAQKAKPHGIDVSKLPSAWSCSICEVTCTCQTDLENHLRGTRHREKVQSLLEQSKIMARDSESQKAILVPDSRWICRIFHAHCTSESDLENHLAGTRHQLNTQDLGLGKKKNPPQVAKKHEPFAKWNCTVCDAKCNSESQFEDHCRSSRHQQKIQAMILSKGKVVKGSSSRAAANELPSSDGSDGKNPSSEMAEKRPAVYFCEVCSVLFESSTMLVHHRFGKKHRAKLSHQCEE
uniref:Uncharacterized protein n=1 Tax=Avena sativa TaxID=4498 RepID=A0ACD5XS50_AVESA